MRIEKRGEARGRVWFLVSALLRGRLGSRLFVGREEHLGHRGDQSACASRGWSSAGSSYDRV